LPGHKRFSEIAIKACALKMLGANPDGGFDKEVSQVMLPGLIPQKRCGAAIDDYP